eukprot:147690-Pelagomonas_calceolata.AAC.3
MEATSAACHLLTSTPQTSCQNSTPKGEWKTILELEWKCSAAMTGSRNAVHGKALLALHDQLLHAATAAACYKAAACTDQQRRNSPPCSESVPNERTTMRALGVKKGSARKVGWMTAASEPPTYTPALKHPSAQRMLQHVQ